LLKGFQGQRSKVKVICVQMFECYNSGGVGRRGSLVQLQILNSKLIINFTFKCRKNSCLIYYKFFYVQRLHVETSQTYNRHVYHHVCVKCSFAVFANRVALFSKCQMTMTIIIHVPVINNLSTAYNYTRR